MENTPIIQSFEAGTYYICTCRKSANGIFCNGAHRDTDKKPHQLILEEAKTIALCLCGQSSNGIYCDGSHTKIKPSETPEGMFNDDTDLK